MKIQKSKSAATPVVTLSSLYCQDLHNAYIMPEYPSSFQKNAKFLNENKYFIHDFPPLSLEYIEYLRPIRMCPVAGNDLPILLHHPPNTILQDHWNKWLPWFPEPDVHNLVTVDTGDEKLITLYPLESVPKMKHAIDPDAHFEVLSKAAIPEMGALCPKHMSLDNFTLPCMMKATHGLSCKGTYLVKTEEEAVQVLEELRTDFSCADPVVTDVIQGITGNYCLQFYLFGNGNVQWLGVTNQIITSNCRWGGGVLNWDEQEDLKNMLFATVEPVMKYLHCKGYFGIVGVDVLKNDEGQYVVDVNPRVNGSTPLLLIAPHMAQLGLKHSRFMTGKTFSCNMKKLVEETNEVNQSGDGFAVILSAADTQHGCEAHIAVFGKTAEGPCNIYDRLAVAAEKKIGKSI